MPYPPQRLGQGIVISVEGKRRREDCEKEAERQGHQELCRGILMETARIVILAP